MSRVLIKYSFLISILLMATASNAHHIRGLPHYAYSENYPQVPVVEERRIADEWEYIFSYIRIFQTNNYDLAVYIKNTKTGKPFKGIVNYKVFGKGENPDIQHAHPTKADPTNTFRVGWSYENDGIYTVRIAFDAGGKSYTEEFKMQVGEVGFNYLWVILPGIVVFTLLLLVVIKRLKEKR